MLLLAPPEAAYLASYLGRLRTWDAGAAVRLQARGGVVGAYAAPAPRVLSLVVVPLAEPVTGTSLDGLDEVLSAGRLRDVLGTVTDDRTRELRIPDAVVGPAALSQLPPRGGWDPVATGSASDVLPATDEPTPVPDGATGWAGLPVRALQVAQGLGLLVKPDAAVRASRTSVGGGWERLEMPGGQVFVRSGSPNLLEGMR